MKNQICIIKLESATNAGYTEAVRNLSDEFAKRYTAAHKIYKIYSYNYTDSVKNNNLEKKINKCLSNDKKVELITAGNYGVNTIKYVLSNSKFKQSFNYGKLRITYSSDKIYKKDLFIDILKENNLYKFNISHENLLIILPNYESLALKNELIEMVKSMNYKNISYGKLLERINKITINTDLVPCSNKITIINKAKKFIKKNKGTLSKIFNTYNLNKPFDNNTVIVYVGGRVQKNNGELIENTVERFQQTAIDILKYSRSVNAKNIILFTHKIRGFSDGLSPKQNNFKPYYAMILTIESMLLNDENVIIFGQKEVSQNKKRPIIHVFKKKNNIVYKTKFNITDNPYNYGMLLLLSNKNYTSFITGEQITGIAEIFEVTNKLPDYIYKWSSTVDENIQFINNLEQKTNNNEIIKTSKEMFSNKLKKIIE